MRDEDSHELREEAKQERYEQRYIPWIDPRDPDYIGPEDEEEWIRIPELCSCCYVS